MKFRRYGVAVAAVIISACHFSKLTSKSFLPSEKWPARDTLFVNFETTPPGNGYKFNWTTEDDPLSLTIERNVMEGLVGYDFSGQVIEATPMLAREWSSNDNGTRYTFKLRDDVKWSDGKPLKAEDFISAFQHLLSPSTHSRWAELLFAVRNARAFNEGKVSKFSDVGIVAPNSQTLVFNLNEPVNYFLYVFGHPATFPLRKDIIEKDKDWALADRMVTLGAYRFAEATSQKYLILTRNDSYYGVKANVKNIVLQFGLPVKVVQKMFSLGEVDIVAGYDLEFLKKLNGEIISSDQLDLTYLTFNMKKKPLNNPIFRRAVAISIDREELARSLPSEPTPFKSLILPRLIGYESNRGVRFDALVARELLKHSGYADISKYGDFVFKIDTSSEARKVAENIAAQLKRNLDLNVTISTTAEGASFSVSHEQAFVPDPEPFLRVVKKLPGDVPWKSRSYLDDIHRAETTTMTDQRKKYYAKAQHILTEEEIPIFPLYLVNHTFAVQQRVENFSPNSLGFFLFKGVALK